MVTIFFSITVLNTPIADPIRRAIVLPCKWKRRRDGRRVRQVV